MFGRKKDKEKEREGQLRDEMRRLEEQMAELRRRMEEEKDYGREVPPKSPTEPRRAKGVRIDIDDEALHEEMEEFGRRMGTYGVELGDYIKTVVSDAMRGANRAMRSVFIGPKGARVRVDDNEVSWDPEGVKARQVPPEEAQRLLAPLANEDRIRILYLLADEPRYHQDLMELSGLTPGTLPHHLKQLEDAGYVTQERVRGRYLITIPGRMALKLAEYLHNQMTSGIGKDTD
ncbi:MAG: ArsR/SmtB family transcription factor [Promethearchaeota archaeon]